MPVHAHRTERVPKSEGREGANGVGGEIKVGGGNGDGNGVGGGDGGGDGDKAGTGTEAEMEANEGAQDGNEDGNEDRSGDRAGTETGARVETRGRTQDGNGDGSRDGNESNSRDENGDEDGNGNGNEDRIGESGRETKKRQKSHKSCRRHVGSGGDLAGKGVKCRKERAGPVASDPDHLENNKEAGGGGHKVPRA